MADLDAATVPQQCVLVPLFPGEQRASVRICVVVHQPTPGGSGAEGLVQLSTHTLGRAYLGALADAQNTLLAWLELNVQTSEGAPFDEEIGTNPEFDARWQAWVRTLAQDGTVIGTGQEGLHLSPLWLDPKQRRAVSPVDPGSGEPYELCRDDAVLLMAGQSPFAESRDRFLAVKGQPGAGLVAPLGEPPGGLRSIQDVLPAGGAGLLPFNPDGGFILVRRLPPLEWTQFASLLSGQSFRGLQAGRPSVKLTGPYAALDDWDRLQQGGAYLFSTNRGRSGRFHEAFDLKLLLFSNMLKAVKERVTASQLPQLNLSPAAFRVELSALRGALPVLWTARPVLMNPPASLALTAPGELKYFKFTGDDSVSIYRPEGAGRAVKGQGELRIRKLVTMGERVQVEATVASSEVVRVSPRDLVWAKLALPGVGTLDLVGNIDAADALAQGEARFRTSALELSPAVLAALRKAEGGAFPRSHFRTVPLLSTPVDLHALGVLAAQLFFGGAGKALATTVDDLISLSRALPPASETPLGELVRTVVASDRRWTLALGPHHHGFDAETADAAMALLPAELWWDTVGAIARLFPGSGPRAHCRDFGDAPAYQIDAVFQAPVAEFEILVGRSQSLLLCDWPANREMTRVIQKLR